MERNENGYSSYNLTPDGVRGGRGGCQQEPGRSSGSGGTVEGAAGGTRGGSCNGGMPDGAGSMNGVTGRLAMAYVPMQCWRMLYSPDYALTRGSLFEELDLPLEECTNE